VLGKTYPNTGDHSGDTLSESDASDETGKEIGIGQLENAPGEEELYGS
jgi:hypothetical protein